MAYRFENKEILIDQDIAIGIKFPFNGQRIFNSTFTTLEQSNSNIKNLLLTGKGERFQLNEFGTVLKYLLFEQQSTELKIAIDEEIRNAVNRWLPYVSIESIETNYNSPADTYITIKITYIVSNIEAEQSLTLSSKEDGSININP
jgi:phage baseplate assembly protein W